MVVARLLWTVVVVETFNGVVLSGCAREKRRKLRRRFNFWP
jgi:hypothetical protein